MRYLGNIAAGQTVNFLFPTNNADGAAVAPTTAGTVSVYKDANTGETAAGVTYTPSFDGAAGVNLVSIATSDAFYAAGHDYAVVLGGAVIDGQTVNAVLATFSIVFRHATADNLPTDYQQRGVAVTLPVGTAAGQLKLSSGQVETSNPGGLTPAESALLTAIGQAAGTLTVSERNAVADALLDRAGAIETGKSVRQALRIMAAVLAGKVSGAGTGTETFKGVDGATTRVTVTADASGNRTNVNYA
jgi:hypothetical protein